LFTIPLEKPGWHAAIRNRKRGKQRRTNRQLLCNSSSQQTWPDGQMAGPVQQENQRRKQKRAIANLSKRRQECANEQYHNTAKKNVTIASCTAVARFDRKTNGKERTNSKTALQEQCKLPICALSGMISLHTKHKIERGQLQTKLQATGFCTVQTNKRKQEAKSKACNCKPCQNAECANEQRTQHSQEKCNNCQLHGQLHVSTEKQKGKERTNSKTALQEHCNCKLPICSLSGMNFTSHQTKLSDASCKPSCKLRFLCTDKQ
jgi:hypothetical protein